MNTSTIGKQWYPSVGMAPDGDFVVVWNHSGGGTYGQRYLADGTPAGGEFRLDTHTASTLQQVDVAVNPDGSFVAVWTAGWSETDTSDMSVQGRRYASDGTVLGDQFQVNTLTTGAQWFPSVATGGDGSFVVVWMGYVPFLGSPTRSVKAQRFAASGIRLGGEFQVNAFTVNATIAPSVSAKPDGSFVVVWENSGTPFVGDDHDGIHGRRFSPDGTPLGAEFQVNAYTTSFQQNPSVSTDADGSFVVAWDSDGSAGGDFDSTSIQARRFGSDGTPLGPEFQVNELTSGPQQRPVVSTDAAGRFVVVWRTQASLRTVSGRGFAPDGTPLGREFGFETLADDLFSGQSVSLDDEGHFVVAWHDKESNGTDSSQESVHARRYTFSLFADGFETGNMGAWSSAVP